MKLRKEFVLEVLADGRAMKEICRDYGISRRTGYKWLKRYRERGELGLLDRSRRPKSRPLDTSGELVMQVVELKRQRPRWGPKKIHASLVRSNGSETLSRRTVARILDRAGLVKKRTRRRGSPKAQPKAAPAVEAVQPNDLWTIDFKGWWRTRDGTRCEPLTVRDAASRYVLALYLCRPTHDAVRAVMEELFERYGVPSAILSDNGQPFACTRALAGMTRLSAWWVSLGIEVYRSRPGCPQDNGGHERMHVDVRFELEDKPASTLEAQQAACDVWRDDFNHRRPHEALGMRMPAEVYRNSERRAYGQLIGGYPDGYILRSVSKGNIELFNTRIWVSKSIDGYQVGLRHIQERTYHVYFYQVLIGELTLGESMEVVPIGVTEERQDKDRAA